MNGKKYNKIIFWQKIKDESSELTFDKTITDINVKYTAL